MGDEEKGKEGSIIMQEGSNGSGMGSVFSHMKEKLLSKAAEDDKDDKDEASDSESESGDDDDTEGGDGEDSEEADSEEGDAEGDEDSDEEEEGEEDGEEDDGEEEEGEEEDDSEDGDAKRADADRLKPKTPVFAVCSDGRRIKIPPDAKLLIKVDGKETPVNVHKAVSEYSGKYFVDKEMNKVRTMERTVTAKSQEVDKIASGFKQIDEVIASAFEKVKKGEGLDSYHELAMLTGKFKDPVEWEVEHLKAMIPLAQEIAGMTVEEQNSWIRNRRLDYYEKEKAREAESKKQDPEKVQVQTEIKQVRQAHKISDDEWTEASGILRQVRDDGKLKDYGITTVTPAVCADVVLTIRAQKRVDSVLKEHPNLGKRFGKEKVSEIRDLITEAVKTYGGTDDDIESILQEAVKDLKEDGSSDADDAKRLGKRFKGSKPPRTGTANPNKKKKSGPRTFDELRSELQRRQTQTV